MYALVGRDKWLSMRLETWKSVLGYHSWRVVSCAGQNLDDLLTSPIVAKEDQSLALLLKLRRASTIQWMPGCSGLLETSVRELRVPI